MAIATLLFHQALQPCGSRGLAFTNPPDSEPARGPVRVALTRQAGENGKLKEAITKALTASGLKSDTANAFEVPCIEHARGPDFEQLEVLLAGLAEPPGGRPETVVLTSPEAARTFLEARGRPPTMAVLPFRVATIGRGTSMVVRKAGLSVDFEPSTATAECLAAELPEDFGPTVLYAASSIAPGTLQEGLEARKFVVQRLNVYTTKPVEQPPPAMLEEMEMADIATFGSPSAVKAWAKHCVSRPIAACIGETSQVAAKASGFDVAFAPGSPGIEGWAEVTVEAIRQVLTQRGL